MKNAPSGAAGEAMPKYDRTAIMRRAWVIFHANRRIGRAFDRKLFAQSLRAAWGDAKRQAQYEREQVMPVAIVVLPKRPMSPMEAAIDALKYLPFGMSAARAEAAIRARYVAYA